MGMQPPNDDVVAAGIYDLVYEFEAQLLETSFLMTMVVFETLRLSLIGRTARKDTKLGNLMILKGIEKPSSSIAFASIISCYTNLELLDLSGSSITVNGVGMICNALPRTLSTLCLALWPNIT
ncbi:hypothetical protein IEQ34_013849 [Dendrobium chrysotoxum]|uniref:Uncharacterized protein n=1 Tax=Dendrobium chrysotoxum TaxID=161865 RepID=A0AAV7G9S0_DENCH|nr:hypothetical protein IEQ34_013849 [Dendrobium chrysotoxum]